MAILDRQGPPDERPQPLALTHHTPTLAISTTTNTFDRCRNVNFSIRPCSRAVHRRFWTGALDTNPAAPKFMEATGHNGRTYTVHWQTCSPSSREH